MSDHPSNRVETLEQLKTIFTYHAPRGDQPERYAKIREAGWFLAKTILECCPDCADRTVAIRRVREAVMVANAAVALEAEVS